VTQASSASPATWSSASGGSPESRSRHTPTFQGLSFRFAARFTDSSLGDYVRSVFEPLEVRGFPDHVYSVVTAEPNRIDIYLDGALVACGSDAANAVEWLMWDLNQRVVRASSEHVLFHAAGVEANGRAVLLPGRSGSGKTTLAGALVHSGLAYLSDEVIALHKSRFEVLPYPRALVLKGDGFNPLFDLLPSPCPARFVAPRAIRPGAIGRPCPPRFVVFPRYSPGTPTSMKRVRPDSAFIQLVANTVNMSREGAEGVGAVAQVASRCACFELVTSDLDVACKRILDCLE
jgi:energy-coupling factor transporter ATP-binding protein EcfA2